MHIDFKKVIPAEKVKQYTALEESVDDHWYHCLGLSGIFEERSYDLRKVLRYESELVKNEIRSTHEFKETQLGDLWIAAPFPAKVSMRAHIVFENKNYLELDQYQKSKLLSKEGTRVTKGVLFSKDQILYREGVCPVQISGSMHYERLGDVDPVSMLNHLEDLSYESKVVTTLEEVEAMIKELKKQSKQPIVINQEDSESSIGSLVASTLLGSLFG